MSDPTPPSSSNEEKPKAEAPKTKAAKASAVRESRARKWRKRLTRLILIAFVLSVLMRVLVHAIFPPVLRKVAASFGLNAEYDKLELYLVGGDVGIWGLKFTPFTGGPSVVTVSYCRGSISTLGLLRGHLNVNRVEAEGTDITIERTADGKIPMIEQLAGNSPASNQPSDPTKQEQLILDPPLTIQVARLQDARTHFRDQSVMPATDITFQMDALVTGVGFPGQRAHFDVALNSPDALAALYVTGSGQTKNNVLDADLTIRMYGLNLKKGKTYLAMLGLDPVAGDMSARADGKFQARLTGGPTTTQPSAPANLSATLSLTDVALLSESREAASVKSVKVEASSLAPGALKFSQIAIDGVHGVASRSRRGLLSFAGIELVGGTQTAAPTTKPTSAMPLIELREVLVHDTDLSFTDNAMSRPVTLGLNVPKITLANLTTEPARATAPATLLLEGSAPGIAKSIIVQGSTSLQGNITSIQCAVNVTGINPTAAEPYLEAVQLKRQISDGAFACTITGTLEPKDDGSQAVSMKISDSKLTVGGSDLITMPLIELQNAVVDAKNSRLRVDQISLVGPVVSAHRGTNGVIEALGILYDPAAVVPAANPADTVSPATKASSTIQPAALPAIAITKFTWRGAGIHFDDASGPQPIDLALNDLQVDGNNLSFDPAGSSTTPGDLKVQLASPGVIEKLTIDGKLLSAPRTIDFDFQGNGTGVSLEKLKPILSAIGVEPVLHDGSLQFNAAGKFVQRDDALGGDLGITKVHFTDGSSDWLSMDNLHVGGASFDGKTFAIDTIQIDKPTAQISRDADGAITVAGMKLLPPKRTTPSTAPSTTLPTSETRLDLTLPIIAKVKSIRAHDVAINLSDDAVLPSSKLAATLNFDASNVLLGAEGEATKFSLTLASPGAIDSLKVDGDAKLEPLHQEVHLTATGSGITGKTLEPYLPPNIAAKFNNGQFNVTLSALVEPNAEGGSKAKLSITDAKLMDGVSPDPAGSIAALRIEGNRVDLPQHRIDIAEIAVEHASLVVKQDESGLSLMGLTFAPKPLRPVKSAPPTSKPTASAAASDVNALVAQSRQKSPLITIDKLSIGADRLSFESPALGKPLAVTDLSLTNSGRIELLGDNPMERPPTDLKFRAAVDGLINSIALNARLAPFATNPSAKLGLNVTGIRGNELTAFFPQLKDKLDGADLSDGQFAASVDAQFTYTRRGTFGIDPTRDISSTFEVKDVKLAQAGADKSLASLEGIHGESVKYSPASGSVVIKSLDITKPGATVIRDKEGIHLLGLTLHVPTTQPSDNAATEPAISPSPTIAEVPSSIQPAVATAEYRIDRLTINGADFRIEDHVGSPVTILPINQLDVDVKGLSSLALTEPNKPIRFSALLGAGKVPLPPRKQTAGVATEDRPVFAEASATGNVTLVPKPQGFIKASLSGLELTSIRGLAQEQGIALSGATFDVRADVRMRGADTFDANVYPTFNELRLSEAANGAIQRGLRLPAPPDVVIGALEDTDGSISFPLVVPIEAGKLEKGPVIESAVGSLGKVVAAAMLAAPLKAASLIPMLGGADLSPERTKGIAPIIIDFAPGESELTPQQSDEINRAILAMKRDDSIAVTIQHTLGAGDLQLVEQRANPTAQDASAIASELRERKNGLEMQLAVLDARARATIPSQNPEAVRDAFDSLRGTATELKDTDDALDLALDTLTPGADRQSDRRTKIAAITLAGLRLTSVQNVLDRAHLSGGADRIRKATAVFNPEDSDSAGRVTIVLTRRSKG